MTTHTTDSRLAYRVMVALAQPRARPLAMLEVRALINRELERDDALETVGAHICPKCDWIGDEPDSKMTHPGNNSREYPSPPDYEPVCPKCGAFVEDAV
jgi:hypothetical protein